MSTVLAALPFVVLAALALVSADDRRPRLFTTVKPAATLSLLLVAGGAWSVFAIGVKVALVLSAFGDAALNRKRERGWFLAGMGLFALAHAAYATAFIGAGFAPSIAAVTVSAIALAGVVILLRLLWPGIAPVLRGPCVGYGLTIMATVVAASAVPGWTGTLLLACALLFYLGDVALALSQFGRPFLYSQTVSMFLYWSGQLGFALAARWHVA